MINNLILHRKLVLITDNIFSALFLDYLISSTVVMKKNTIVDYTWYDLKFSKFYDKEVIFNKYLSKEELKKIILKLRNDNLILQMIDYNNDEPLILYKPNIAEINKQAKKFGYVKYKNIDHVKNINALIKLENSTYKC